jgi:hypothetical protein
MHGGYLRVRLNLGAAPPYRNILFSMTERLIPKRRNRIDLNTLKDSPFVVIRNYRTKMWQKRRLALRRENYRRKRSQNSPKEADEEE